MAEMEVSKNILNLHNRNHKLWLCPFLSPMEVSLHLLNYPKCADNCSHLVGDGGRWITFLTPYI